jgi:hypothetical protein
LDSQAASRKANHRSVNAARMLNSFGVTVPQIMNKKNSSEPFSLVPDHAKWKSNDGRSGLVETIRKALKLWSTQTAGRLTSRFSSSERSPCSGSCFDEQVYGILDLSLQLDR